MSYAIEWNDSELEQKTSAVAGLNKAQAISALSLRAELTQRHFRNQIKDFTAVEDESWVLVTTNGRKIEARIVQETQEEPIEIRLASALSDALSAPCQAFHGAVTLTHPDYNIEVSEAITAVAKELQVEIKNIFVNEGKAKTSITLKL